MVTLKNVGLGVRMLIKLMDKVPVEKKIKNKKKDKWHLRNADKWHLR